MTNNFAHTSSFGIQIHVQKNNNDCESIGGTMIIHKELAAGKWFELSPVEQLANVGSDFVGASFLGIQIYTYKFRMNKGVA